MRYFVLAALTALAPLSASAAQYVVVCAAPCAASDGTTQPAGTVLNRIVAALGFSPGAGLTLQADTGQAIYAPPAPTPSPAQQAAALLAGGVTVTSTSTPAINGTYGLDPATTANINAISTYVLVNPGSFPTGATQAFIDLAGNPHVFTSTATWQAFASAAAKVAALVALYGNGIGGAPSMSVTIP